MLLTPEGKIARYYFGISYPAKDLRLGLIEASDGKIGSPIDQILLLCYHYDPRTGKYNLAIMRILQVLGCATAASLGTFMLVMLRRDRSRPGPSALAREGRQGGPPSLRETFSRRGHLRVGPPPPPREGEARVGADPVSMGT